jgi:hypothetical protein
MGVVLSSVEEEWDMALQDKAELRSYDIHWSAILAGAFTSVGVWLFIYALGAAIGGAGGQQQVDTWTAVYTVCAPVIAFFFGGMVISRSRGILTKGDGAVHGIVAWGFATVIGSVLLATMGAELLRHEGGVNVVSGYMWAVAGSILGSLIASVLGSMMVNEDAAERISARRREETTLGSTTRREVYP